MIQTPEVLEKMHNFSTKEAQEVSEPKKAKIYITKLKLKVRNTDIKPLLKP
jgi:hypothetical protein